MEVREYTAEDYSTVAKWWEKHNSMPFVPKEFLPKIGLMVNNVAALFLYGGDYDVWLLQWPVSNLDNSPISVFKAFDSIVKKYINTLKKGEMLITYPNSTGLQRLYKRNGFTMVNDFNKEMYWGCA